MLSLFFHQTTNQFVIAKMHNNRTKTNFVGWISTSTLYKFIKIERRLVTPKHSVCAVRTSPYFYTQNKNNNNTKVCVYVYSLIQFVNLFVSFINNFEGCVYSLMSVCLIRLLNRIYLFKRLCEFHSKRLFFYMCYRYL